MKREMGIYFLGTDYTDYMDFLRKSLVFVILSGAKNLPHVLGDASPARTGRCFTTFSMIKVIRDQSV